MDGYFSTARAAEHLGVTPIRVRQWITAGVLPAQRLGREYAIRIEDVEFLRTVRARDAEAGRRPGRPPGRRNQPRAAP